MKLRICAFATIALASHALWQYLTTDYRPGWQYIAATMAWAWVAVRESEAPVTQSLPPPTTYR